MSKARFRVHSQLDNAGGEQDGEVIIDRAAGTITVRPLRGRPYTMRLCDVATMICRQVIYAENYDKRKAKR